MTHWQKRPSQNRNEWSSCSFQEKSLSSLPLHLKPHRYPKWKNLSLRIIQNVNQFHIHLQFFHWIPPSVLWIELSLSVSWSKFFSIHKDAVLHWGVVATTVQFVSIFEIFDFLEFFPDNGLVLPYTNYIEPENENIRSMKKIALVYRPICRVGSVA